MIFYNVIYDILQCNIWYITRQYMIFYYRFWYKIMLKSIRIELQNDKKPKWSDCENAMNFCKQNLSDKPLHNPLRGKSDTKQRQFAPKRDKHWVYHRHKPLENRQYNELAPVCFYDFLTFRLHQKKHQKWFGFLKLLSPFICKQMLKMIFFENKVGKSGGLWRVFFIFVAN